VGYRHHVPYRWLPVAFGICVAAGVEPYEVLQVLTSGRRYVVPAVNDVGIVFRTIWGLTREGRGLIVVTKQRDGFDSEIVGARPMTEAEREVYERWV
jgi:hypothetical protein